MKIIRRAVAADPGNPLCWLDQGMLLAQDGQDVPAADALQTALTLAPDLAEAHAQLAAIRIRQGLLDAAVALQAQAVEHEPANDRYARSLASYRAMAGHRANAQHAQSSMVGETNTACPIEQALRGQFPTLAQRVDAIDWDAANASLTEQGYVLLPQLLVAGLCEPLRAMFHADEHFAETVTMDKAHFGRGCYRYFASQLPTLVEAVRQIVYPFAAEIANGWQQLLGAEEYFPLRWEGMRIRCMQAGQETPSPILLRYEAGGFNDLHRDIRGNVFFPLQLAVVLSPRRKSVEAAGEGFTGGEFLFADAGSRKGGLHPVPAGLGDAVLFCTRSRLTPIAGVYGLQSVKHGAAEVTSGTRYVLGVPFHEYT